jgi:hypothetical protein
MTCRLITVLVVLGSWGGPGVHSVLAQNHPSPSKLVRQLRSDQTTDNARDELLRLGKSDPSVRQYLAVHLPSVIESGPSTPVCSGNSCEPWLNAVELGGHLKIDAAAPALAKWINWRSPGPSGLSLEARLVFYPAARALIEIGDPAVPAVQYALDRGNSHERYRAVRVLNIIDSPSARAVLRKDLQHEPDPDLRAMIKRDLAEERPVDSPRE